ncbi:MAG: hypothetical protein WAM89_14945 [Terriglobales bacterium]
MSTEREMVNNQELQDLIADGRQGRVQFLRPRELAAVMESLGCTDHSAKAAGFDNVFSFAEYHFATFQSPAKPSKVPAHRTYAIASWVEAQRALRKCSLSLAYAVPWIALLAIEYLRPNALKVSPELGGALSLSLVASLMSSGGFIQMISHSGHFYYGLEEPLLARRICMSLVNLGGTCSLLLALFGTMVSWYFHLFAGDYLFLAALNYLALSILWMFCAVLAVQGRGWCIPLLFLVSALIIGVIKITSHLGTAILMALWPVVTVVAAFSFVVAGFRRVGMQAGTVTRVRPRRWVYAISLVPLYLYGTAYFTFLFADRLAAGSAISWVSGLSFGIDPAYKRGMDLALLAFLVTAGLAEYLGDSFLRFWHRLARELPVSAGDQLMLRLRYRHKKTMFAIVSLFVVITASEGLALSHSDAMAASSRLWQTALLGCLGYLLLSMALLDTIILASVKANSMALSGLAPGLVANIAIGYGLSHLWGVQYAAVGLLAGSVIVLWKCQKAVQQVLRRPDYHYSVS